MDGTQSTPVPERQQAAPEVGAEQALSDKLEAKVAPVAAEATQSTPKSDDGAAVAQAQVVVAANQGDDTQVIVAPAANATPSAEVTAADVDVIEPEWVKKAEEAVAKNREDPRAEEKAVEAVQIEYLKKRYNLDVKPGDDKP